MANRQRHSGDDRYSKHTEKLNTPFEVCQCIAANANYKPDEKLEDMGAGQHSLQKGNTRKQSSVLSSLCFSDIWCCALPYLQGASSEIGLQILRLRTANSRGHPRSNQKITRYRRPRRVVNLRLLLWNVRQSQVSNRL